MMKTGSEMIRNTSAKPSKKVVLEVEAGLTEELQAEARVESQELTAEAKEVADDA